ncbi:o-succinylbenzoate--CoA ligase [Nocardia grenadensis]|uniref:o-succinylbenzoate--CoA ligase n=1 Tax=Nocardia grenadensis TaxID=931537 RepID=UPI0007A3A391|nr:o-succinylbenzoate--CoA ligase [Nocardia grenadensis]
MRNQGVGSWPARRSRGSSGQTAIIFGDQRLTYADLHERINRLGNALRELGVGKGSRVAYLGPNLPSFVESMFAVQAIGAVFVPLNTRLTTAELRYQLDNCRAQVLIAAAANTSTAQQLRGGTIRILISENAASPGETYDYETLLRKAESTDLDETVELGDPALILYTSGTTGKPKGATLTHGNITWNCMNVVVDIDVTSTEVTLVSAPLFHVAALNMTMLPTILKGGTAVLMDRWDIDACYNLIERHGVTFMFGVPSMFAGLADAPRWTTADLSSVRLLVTGGAPVPRGLIETFQERELTFLQGFGMTEAAPGTMIVGSLASTQKIGTAGVPHFFTDVRIARDELRNAGVGEPGEILIKGPNVMPGYWEAPEATAAAFTDDGWFRSGDIAAYDEEGYIYIIDRMKDMYISGGENVYPAEVESILARHPAVSECAVIGVADETWGEIGHAFVILNGHIEPSPGDLRTYLESRLAKYKLPRFITFVDELPRTGSGKIAKHRLRALHGSS